MHDVEECLEEFAKYIADCTTIKSIWIRWDENKLAPVCNIKKTKGTRFLTTLTGERESSAKFIYMPFQKQFHSASESGFRT